jgi:uncharacterized membrane protein required for colicin V production
MVVFALYTVLIMLILAYAFWKEGPLTSFAMCVNILLAGLLAFNFWEPIADLFDPLLEDSFAAGIEDSVALMVIFLPTLMILRWITNSLASTHVEYPSVLYRGGAVLFGLLAGYLLAGFLICVIQTLPVPREFLQFEPYDPAKAAERPIRKFMPPDVAWLAMMNRLSAAGLSRGEDELTGTPIRFDVHGSFQMRYRRYRRYDEGKDGSKPMEWRGEIEP